MAEVRLKPTRTSALEGGCGHHIAQAALPQGNSR